jgi:hypothetical protein
MPVGLKYDELAWLERTITAMPGNHSQIGRINGILDDACLTLGLNSELVSGHSQKGRGIMRLSNCIVVRLFLAALLLLVAAGASAQDIAKVSPETHKLLLENEHVRVFDVQIKPGEKVGMHSHPAGILYYLSNASLKITYSDGKTEVREVKSGTAVWSEGELPANVRRSRQFRATDQGRGGFPWRHYDPPWPARLGSA